jgi:fructose-specific component phosphotransferase system IIB-like protein
MIFIAATDADIENCFDVINELRLHLVKDQFVETVRSMEKQGFKLAFLQVDSQVVAVTGYCIYNNLYMGKHCYIDDLVTALAHRSKGS